MRTPNTIHTENESYNQNRHLRLKERVSYYAEPLTFYTYRVVNSHHHNSLRKRAKLSSIVGQIKQNVTISGEVENAQFYNLSFMKTFISLPTNIKFYRFKRKYT